MKGINKIKTRAILITVFLVPVFFILFLKFCSENHYAVNVYYRHGINHRNVDCQTDSSQYRIVSFPFTRPGGSACDTSAIRGKFTVFSIRDSSDRKLNEKIVFNLKRILNDLNNPKAVQAYIITAGNISDDVAQKGYGTDHSIQYLTGDRADISQFARCGLILPVDSIFNELVLADRQGRIRGYYKAARFNEYDRLQVELKILLKETGNEE